MLVPTVDLRPGYRVSRLIRGGWQSIGTGQSAVAQLTRFASAGITTFETADIYPGGEEFIGTFLKDARLCLPEAAICSIRVHTRCTVPLTGCNTEAVRQSVERSLHRLGRQRLDLLQLQYWDWQVPPGLVETGLAMAELQRQGKVARLGVCNLGVGPLARLLDAGVPIATNQVPCSLVDRRADRALAEYCARQDIALLTYGPLAGGFLCDGWLGATEPASSGASHSEEYLQVVHAGVGWTGLQRILSALSTIARQRSRSVAQVALRWVLQRGPGAAVLFGASSADRLADILPVFEFELTDAECAALEAGGNSAPPGDIGELERTPDSALCQTIRGRHRDPGTVDAS